MTTTDAKTMTLRAHDAVRKFVQGVRGLRPQAHVAGSAERLAQLALDKTVEPEMAVDGDGVLYLDLRLPDGRLLLAEVRPDGGMAASLYSPDHALLERVADATEGRIWEAVHGYAPRP